MLARFFLIVLLGAGIFPALSGCTSSSSPKVQLISIPEVKKSLQTPGKVLVVNHWATWCAPCVEELPLLASVAKKFEGKVEFVGVSWDMLSADATETPKILANVLDRAKKSGLPYLSYVVEGGAEDLGKALDLQSLVVPQTYVFDKTGKKLRMFEVLKDQADATELEKTIEQALK